MIKLPDFGSFALEKDIKKVKQRDKIGWKDVVINWASEGREPRADFSGAKPQLINRRAEKQPSLYVANFILAD